MTKPAESTDAAETSEHLVYEKHDPAGRGSGNSRNGTRAKSDTDSTFEPQILAGASAA
jgi:putative transposase